MVNSPVRDLQDYTQQYRRLPFEPIQAEYRRRLILQRIEAARPRRVLEVGCGEQPLFTDLPAIAMTVVEPSTSFADQARALAGTRDDVQIVCSLLEEASVELGLFDGVVISSLLHEVPDPQALLRAARRFCAPGAWLHVNVPNANSLHRLLAVAMGLISSAGAPSQTQRTMQQQRTYDAASLRAVVTDAGFRVTESGSLFVKPFTHQQMQLLVDQGFMTKPLLDGLDRLSLQLPDIGSEIWCEARSDDV